MENLEIISKVSFDSSNGVFKIQIPKIVSNAAQICLGDKIRWIVVDGELIIEHISQSEELNDTMVKV